LDLKYSLKSYIENFSTALSFALLFVFVLPILWFSGSFMSSGTIFLDYGFIKLPFFDAILLLGLSIAFLFFYSILICLMVFAVRRDMNKVRLNYYLAEKIHKFGLKYFYFVAIFTIVSVIIVPFLISYGIPTFAINIFIGVFSLLFFFLPQTLVVDEESLRSSILSNWEFMLKNPKDVLTVFLFGFFAVLIIQLFEFAVDYFFLIGNYFSLFIALVFLVPFLEVMKTRIYMNRFAIVKNYNPGE